MEKGQKSVIMRHGVIDEFSDTGEGSPGSATLNFSGGTISANKSSALRTYSERLPSGSASRASLSEKGTRTKIHCSGPGSFFFRPDPTLDPPHPIPDPPKPLGTGGP